MLVLKLKAVPVGKFTTQTRSTLNVIYSGIAAMIKFNESPRDFNANGLEKSVVVPTEFRRLSSNSGINMFSCKLLVIQ